ncbi:PRC-barrel domain-containing protein [Thermocoleostomius sinensis]|jgi:sporulation protein YlmC with PRC-barrel domain|uniref:PRC-barrel domain-containing protein n=1 Tax=Thermocoleostomius sinensis A174 TaxID=2016057 RepID=A0A9E8ZF01_9CYAN|nr:PRC-barrel domain-containing protein [Thermocoleostomius sinensis]WAL61948.1 PRC-barrel domain-containing protein [Thermocoleostomius sinensis A174]
MTFEQYCQRADLIGTQVITRDGGRRLGIVSQIWVDVDRREVVAFGIRASMLSGVLSNIQQTMLLSNVRQIGDVVLVDDANVIEDDFNTEAYSKLVGSEVITETGDMLGKVRGFKFHTVDGRVESIVIASLGVPQIPDQLISTYELSMDEVVSSGPDRLIVFEGAEEKLNQLSVGLLERVGIGRPPWERDDVDYYPTPTSTTNQLPSGVRTPVEPIRTRTPVAEETWDEDNWQEAQARPQVRAMREPEPLPEYEEANWDDAQDVEYEEVRVENRQVEYAVQEEEVPKDPWEDDENPTPYRAPQVNIPERKRVVEYEEETDY